MEIRLTLRPGMSGTKKLLARYGERLVCVRYRYDRATGRRVKTAELIVEDVAWAGRARKPRRNDSELVGVRIAWNETELRASVKRGRHLEAATAVVGTLLERSPHLGACTAGSSSIFRGKTEPEYIAAYGAIYR